MADTSTTANPAPAPSEPASRVLAPRVLRESLGARLWPHASQLALAWLLVLFVALLGYRVWNKSAPERITSTTAAPKKLGPMNLNAMERDDLLLLPGIGDKLAQRILDHRQIVGPFKNVDELRKVPGIGTVTLNRLRPFLFVVDAEESDTTSEPEPTMAPTPRAKSKKELELAGKRIRINDAKTEELQRLPGIGPKLAQRIIDHREEKGLFRSVQDLRKVAGIGPKTLEKIKSHVSLDSGSVAVHGN